MKKFLSGLAATLFCVFGWAQTTELAPIPQHVSWGDKAFDNTITINVQTSKSVDADARAIIEKLPLTLTTATPKASTSGVKLVVGKVGDKEVKAYRKLVPQHAEGYYLKITPSEIVVAGADDAGTFYGLQTLSQIVAQHQVMTCEVTDWPSVACRGVIEGFYGNPWSHTDRLRQFDFYGKMKMNTYVYGPKDDPYHRRYWRQPYPEKEAALLRELVSHAKKNKVQFVWAVHPGVDIKWNLEDSINVVKKLESVYDLGVRTFAVFFDDIWGEGSKGEKQAGLLNYVTDNFVHKHKDVEPLIMCPTQYNKAWSGGDYLPTLGKQMYPEVRIMWTGNSVVDMIEANDMEWINAQIGRKAFIWLNYPVNDYCQSRLLMGKTYGNGLDIADMVSGFCSNPMEYAEASKVSLFSIADYTWNMPQYDAQQSWERALPRLMPTSAETFKFFCENNVDLGVTGHGLRREGESPNFKESPAYFMVLSQSANQLLADSVNNPEMLREIEPWVRSMDYLGQRGIAYYSMKWDLEHNDSVAFIGHYKAERAMEQAQKAITSRNYEGSIVKAKPVVSGDVVTPWLNEHIAALIKTYKKSYTYQLDALPQQLIEDGEYYIKVNGRYLTDAEAAADRVGDYPVFKAERDVINPQRQQWIIELDMKTERYKITNKQDGRYINEVGNFWKSKNNPYSPLWNTYFITLDKETGRYAIQNAGNGGKAYWDANDERINPGVNAPKYIFEIEAIK